MEDPIYESLVVAAERGGDIAPDVYRRYFELYPEAREVMLHTDELVRGKMLEEVYRLVMVPELEDESEYLDWEVKNHVQAYSVATDMYPAFFEALYSSVRAAAGDAWLPVFDEAWRDRIAALQQEISARSA